MVIDEEHDASYKQEGDPRYDARAVARHRARRSRRSAGRRHRHAPARELAGASAARAAAAGRRPGAAAGRGGRHARRPLRAGPLQARTVEALDEVREGGKAIVLAQPAWLVAVRLLPLLRARLGLPQLRRLAGRPRARSTSLSPLRPHRAPAPVLPRVRVGDPGPPRRGDRAARGAARKALEPLPVFRLDSDIAARRGGQLEILRRFERPSGVLVGTQMVAKGHDFPDVVLSVMLDADATCASPTFGPRSAPSPWSPSSPAAAAEASAGAGSSSRRWRRTPPASAMRPRHDAAGFLAGEMERRRALRYPPFSHLVRIELGRDRGRARPQAVAGRLAGGAGDALPGRHRAARARRPASGARPPPPPAAGQVRATRGDAVAAVRDAVERLAAGRGCAAWRRASTSTRSSRSPAR